MFGGCKCVVVPTAAHERLLINIFEKGDVLFANL